MSITEPEAWGEKYRISEGIYKSLSLRVKELLGEILTLAKIDVVQIEARAKELDSFIEKIKRKEGQYSDPLTQITDLTAARIIVYYQEDVSRVCELIEQEFVIDWPNSVDKSTLLDVDQFGYRSTHYVVQISRQRGKLREWESYKEIRFEIQVRTVLQHAWAAINHKLDYKSANEAPPTLRRNLFRLSALFELADEQFSSIHKDSKRIESEYKDKVADGNFDVPLNDLSLQAYLSSHPQMEATKRLLAAHGYEPEDISAERADRGRKRVARMLQACGIASLNDFDQALQHEVPLAIQFVNLGAKVPIEVMIGGLVAISRGMDEETGKEIYSGSTWPKYLRARNAFVTKALSTSGGVVPARKEQP